MVSLRLNIPAGGDVLSRHGDTGLWPDLSGAQMMSVERCRPWFERENLKLVLIARLRRHLNTPGLVSQDRAPYPLPSDLFHVGWSIRGHAWSYDFE